MQGIHSSIQLLLQLLYGLIFARNCGLDPQLNMLQANRGNNFGGCRGCGIIEAVLLMRHTHIMQSAQLRHHLLIDGALRISSPASQHHAAVAAASAAPAAPAAALPGEPCPTPAAACCWQR